MQSVGLVLWGLSGGVSGGECGVMEGQLEERPEFRIPFVRERSQRLVCMCFIPMRQSSRKWGVGASWLWRGVGPVCRAWHLGSEAGRLPYCTSSFRQNCQWGAVRLINRPPQPALRGVTCIFPQVVTESVQRNCQDWGVQSHQNVDYQ